MADTDIPVALDVGDVDMEDDDTQRLKSSVTRRRGRGFGHEDDRMDGVRTDNFESYVGGDESNKAAKSVEGYVIFVTGVHEEATEEDVRNKFADFGQITNIHVNLDRRTGFSKGYAFIEFPTFREAESAINNCNGTQLLSQTIHCDWAFIKGFPSQSGRGGNRRRR